MRTIRFWIPAIIGALLAPAFLYLAAKGTDHAGAGLGALMLLYPIPLLITMLSAGRPSGDAFLSQAAGALAFGAMVLQFPFYGFIISYAKLKRSLWLRICAGVALLHTVVALVFLAVVLIREWL